MKKMLINATQQEELRIALVDGQKLYDLDMETLYSTQKKSNIYKGKITRIEPSLEAVFVDYGSKRHGFLPFKEIAKEYLIGSTNTQDEKPSMKDMLKEGQEVLVQIEKEERGNKGAALTTYISLAGRFLVLMPNNARAGGVSRRIQGEERRELREVLEQLDVPEDMGVIVRTAGIGRVQEELQWDLDYLLQVWSAICEAYENPNNGNLIYQESNIIVRALRDYLRPDIDQILIDDEKVYQQAMGFMQLVMPANVNKLKFYDDPIPLFTRYQIEGQIESAYQRVVKLPSGGELVIDYTEALVSVDINSSKATKGGDIEETAYQTNLEAAEEIARQMRLRDLGGLIVIDFIDMLSARNRKNVEQALFDATHSDRARVQIGRISRFGLLEMSRQRLRASLDEASHQVCPRCKGQGSVRSIQSLSLSILRLIEEEAMKERTAYIHCELPIPIATYLLNEKRAGLRAIEQHNQVDIILIPNANLHSPDYHIERLREDEVGERKTPSYKLPLQHESEKEPVFERNAQMTREQAAVATIVPEAPAPESVGEDKGEKGALSSLFSKVVAFFKERYASPELPSTNTLEGGGAKNSQKEQNGNSKKRNQRERQNRSQESNRERVANRDNESRRERNLNRDYDNKRISRNANKDKESLNDGVNPTVEELQNPLKTINGKEVRKGRPRDVYAVRGQGKANMQNVEKDSQEVQSVVENKSAPQVEKTEVQISIENKAKGDQSSSVALEDDFSFSIMPAAERITAPALVDLGIKEDEEQSATQENNAKEAQTEQASKATSLVIESVEVKAETPVPVSNSEEAPTLVIESEEVKAETPVPVSNSEEAPTLVIESEEVKAETPVPASSSEEAPILVIESVEVKASAPVPVSNSEEAPTLVIESEEVKALAPVSVSNSEEAPTLVIESEEVKASAPVPVSNSEEAPTLVIESEEVKASAPVPASSSEDAPTLVIEIESEKVEENKDVESVEEVEAPKDNPLRQLSLLGQSPWYDNIHREMLQEGELLRLIREDNLRGVTSNPAIFQKAFSGNAYDGAIRAYLKAHDGQDALALYTHLAVEDIQNACDQMLEVYEKTQGVDGFVSLEVSPEVADDSEKTIAEARLLAERVNRKNLMIKVPATDAGIEALRALTAEGISVNATLIFSVARYREVLEAFIDGLKIRQAQGLVLSGIQSVASFFVSRVDTAVDKALSDEHAALRGRVAIANAQLAYRYYLERTHQDDCLALEKEGAQMQRLLWASTGTKNPNYSDTRYVDLLIGEATVNTIPPATYQAFKDHGTATPTLLRRIDEAEGLLQRVLEAGVDVDEIAKQLEKEGLLQFAKSFTTLLESLDEKIKALAVESGEATLEKTNIKESKVKTVRRSSTRSANGKTGRTTRSRYGKNGAKTGKTSAKSEKNTRRRAPKKPQGEKQNES